MEMAEREVRDLIRPQSQNASDRGNPTHRRAPVQRQPALISCPRAAPPDVVRPRQVDASLKP
jgi:hypothetical protein